MCSDYEAFLEENDLSEEAMLKGLEVSRYDLTPCGPILTMASEIAGTGCFATDRIPVDEIIAPVFINQQDKVWSMAGRFTNHSPTPNARVVSDFTGLLYLVAESAIRRGEEITVNYRQVKAAMGRMGHI